MVSELVSCTGVAYLKCTLHVKLPAASLPGYWHVGAIRAARQLVLGLSLSLRFHL